ncbi:MAG: ureidoglycolate lyase [Pseudomonadota bacterium]
MKRLRARRLRAEAFEPFGDVLEAGDAPHRRINAGRCRRYHDLAALDFAHGRAGVSLFQAQLCRFPVEIALLERHPLGSQCFVPMGGAGYLVVVALDAGGVPGAPRAFVAQGDQAVNYHRDIWHAVLTPVAGGGLFAVIDRIGQGANLVEHHLEMPLTVEAPE